jgi:16S rRNA (guanine966-N2)-methyltransferase
MRAGGGPVRVLGGELSGRPLAAPAGRGTRPTAARVRGALLDALAARCGGLLPAAVLDLFAGSGALGIEALSRGAGRCWFLERDPAALRALRTNLARLGLGPRAIVRAEDAWSVLRGEGGMPGAPHFGLILVDPPYAAGARPVLEALASGPAWSAAPALCALEHGAKEELPARRGSWSLRWRRAYGDTAVSLYASGSGADGPP